MPNLNLNDDSEFTVQWTPSDDADNPNINGDSFNVQWEPPAHTDGQDFDETIAAMRSAASVAGIPFALDVPPDDTTPSYPAATDENSTILPLLNE